MPTKTGLSTPLEDRFGRRLTHLRISVTHRCNYKCFFCHGEGEIPGPDLLSPEDIAVVAKAVADFGCKFFKITGGEPLLREDIVDIVRLVKEASGGEVSMTTNGYFLWELVDRLIDAGLDRVNVSLHALTREVYRVMVGVDGVARVIRGVREARAKGLPVKLNVLVTRYNFGEVPRILEFASEIGADINLIELIPIDMSRNLFEKLYVSLEAYVKHLEAEAEQKYTRLLQSRPVYILPSGTKVEVIRGFCNPDFCAQCSKLRLTHDAKLKPCFMRNDNLVDIYPILSSTLGFEEKVTRIKEAILEANKRREPYFRLEDGKCICADGKYSEREISFFAGKLKA